MTSDGFSTLTAGLMERGSERVRTLLGKSDAPPHTRAKLNGHTANEPKRSAHNWAPAGRGVTNGEPSHDAFLASRRGGSGARLLIHQPSSGDMSEVTVSLRDAESETGAPDTPSTHGQRPTSVTYERRTTTEQDGAGDFGGEDLPEPPVWVDTPSFSGPDRRRVSISPEVERRKSVPPRLKVGVRLEQERYLRLKLASLETGRTQQDLVTSALDRYLDSVGIDRFIRVAMGFGGAEPTPRHDFHKRPGTEPDKH